ncbi:hypothetical protein BDN70DRAFT_321286 [Pholiota conissans]|uniref:Uncharacterized protein n=1 Tax=Pholiota conissans TaxID=109636 RepID=A0A9P5YR59_9AGAR|nr:hypothetical protein BDN70DRAFT_321286 [Pholiota conissans]
MILTSAFSRHRHHPFLSFVELFFLCSLRAVYVLFPCSTLALFITGMSYDRTSIRKMFTS